MAGTGEGDILTLGITAAALTRVAGVVFGVPLAALLLGTWVGGIAATCVTVRSGTVVDLISGVVGVTSLLLASMLVARRGDSVLGLLKLRASRKADLSQGAP
jgi:positive regulator of sigma E activity